jgi:hypothetical protein
MAMTTLRSISTLLTLLATSGCALVAGTSDYEPCGEGEGGCGEGGDGSGASTSSSTSSTSSTGGGCLELSIDVTGNVEVFVDDDDSLDVDDEASRTFCLPAGEHTLTAYCDQSGGERGPAVEVNWGNSEHCAEAGLSCTFSLQKKEDFFVTLVDGADCP